MPLTAPQLNVEEPEDTHNGDTNQALSKVFLEVLPEKVLQQEGYILPHLERTFLLLLLLHFT